MAYPWNLFQHHKENIRACVCVCMCMYVCITKETPNAQKEINGYPRILICKTASWNHQLHNYVQNFQLAEVYPMHTAPTLQGLGEVVGRQPTFYHRVPMEYLIILRRYVGIQSYKTKGPPNSNQIKTSNGNYQLQNFSIRIPFNF